MKEDRLQLCQSKVDACKTGPPGPLGPTGPRGEKGEGEDEGREDHVEKRKQRYYGITRGKWKAR